ncbi:MAG TPA: winged helix-turn-helix transcriptional regulator [Acidimicrobiales bacterium]|jgi:DNA-binding HxlR family transcriptional regulator|nr:winged helix-turn-helix transcriptional regulator [Acidimicrobiales bacterium]
MGDPRAGYGQYCPVTRALDVVGERWSLLIIRDLLVGTSRFNDLARGLPGLSRTLLSKRLRQLEAAGIVTRRGTDYVLTDAGEALHDVVFGLGAWGARWAFGRPRPEELDAELLVWWMHERLDTSGLPGKRHVIYLRFSDDPRRFWIVLEDGVPSVCKADPGYDVDITITSDVATLYEVWVGHLPLREAMSSGQLRFDGTAARVRQMPRVLRLSPIAPLVQAAAPR